MNWSRAAVSLSVAWTAASGSQLVPPAPLLPTANAVSEDLDVQDLRPELLGEHEGTGMADIFITDGQVEDYSRWYPNQ